MKKTLTRIGAVALSLLIFATSSIKSYAEDYSYTYIYDYWEDVQDCPDFYTPSNVYASSDLGLDKNMRTPAGLYMHDNFLYVLDAGNNRIIELEVKSDLSIKLSRVIDSFNGIELNTFSNPTDLAISEDGNWFIADKGNARILKLDSNLNYLMQFDIPVDPALSPDVTFAPSKIVVDTAERVYCCAFGINLGLLKYEADGTFSGFVGATPVIFNFIDYIWKRIATQEQRAQMANFVPTEYDNVYMDKDGFIYTLTTECTEDDLKGGNIDPVRKINLLGSDILIRNGDLPIFGDRYMGTGGGYTGPSQFADCTVFDNDLYACVDQNRGRIFGYDDQGHLMYIFGGNGNMDGYFRKPTSIEHYGYNLFVLDSIDCTITTFITTEFGQLVYDAMDLFDEGEYEKSEACWREAMKVDGNYDMAYIGIGRALLRQKEYKEAMNYFEIKYDDDNYSKAYKQYRKIWVEDHIVIIVIVLLALFLIPTGIGRFKKIKYEIESSDIFKV